MPETNRLEFLKQAGRLAWQGLKSIVTGIEIVIDPNEPEPPSARSRAEGVTAAGSDDPDGLAGGTGVAGSDPAHLAAGATIGSASAPGQPQPFESIASAFGLTAMRASQHRVAAAELTREGSAVSTETLLALVTPTLALYPSAAGELVERHLGLSGDRLAINCVLDEELTGYQLVWLPLDHGVRVFSRLHGGRLALVGGYRRAALLAFGNPAPTSPVWCNVGDDALMRHLPAAIRSRLVMEEHGQLLASIADGRARVALLGGADLDWAERRLDARILLEIAPDAEQGFLPVWGLFTSGRPPLVETMDNGYLKLVPVQADGLERWTGEEPA